MDLKKLLESRKKDIDERIAEFIPRQLDKKSVESVCGKPRYAFDVDTMSEAVNKPVWNLLDRGGKRLRPILFLLSHEVFGGNPENVMDFVVIPEIVHSGTLCVDDVEDDSELRRGKPCLHKIYGVDVAINVGNAMYYLPLLSLKKNKDKFPPETMVKAYEIYAQEMVNISYGQGMDIWWHKGKKFDVSEAEYLQMCAYKTGTLARMAAKLGALFAGASDKQIESIGKFAESIGVAFQIQDDVLNLVGEEFGKGKGVGEDIHEGKRTLLVIRALSKGGKEADRLREILAMHTNNEKLISEAIGIIKRAGAVEYARNKASQLVSQAWLELSPLLVASRAKDSLKAFADYLIKREI
ncbi:polyprenyl synthetase family protein [Candidatus Micrarchaeota archaeon]|nr:polyprenyl synthetase family protein [Candidatus Micrarchaeota archaeon]